MTSGTQHVTGRAPVNLVPSMVEHGIRMPVLPGHHLIENQFRNTVGTERGMHHLEVIVRNSQNPAIGASDLIQPRSGKKQHSRVLGIAPSSHEIMGVGIAREIVKYCLSSIRRGAAP